MYRAGELCLCSVDIYQASTVEEVSGEVDKKWDYILAALTSNGSKLKELAHIDFKMDKVAPAKDGFLPFALDADEEKSNEPGAYMEEVMDFFNAEHICDGLPIIPPTQRRYAAMLEYCPWPEDTKLVDPSGPSGREITVRDVAVNAVMAGCKPEYMPVLIASFRAMAQPRYNFLQSVTTSHPGGNLILVSGPMAKQLGIWGGQGCLGPGFHANATIGRAVNLTIINVCRSVPGVCDLDCIASQAEFTFCFAEEPTYSPWQTVNEEAFGKDTTTVTVLKAEPPHDIIDFLSPTAADLLDTICDSCTTLGSNNSYIPGPLIVVITPDHAMLFERDGYSKKMIQEHIHTYAYHNWPEVQNRGLRPVRPEGFDSRHPIPVTRSPEDVIVVVAGGKGGHSAVILPWALHSDAVTVPVCDKTGAPILVKD